MTDIQTLLEKVRCPECRKGKLLYGAGSLYLHCLECGAEFPLLDGVPALFRLDELPQFLDYNAKRQIKSVKRTPKTSMAIYHWNIYNFDKILPSSSDGQDLLIFGCGAGDERPLMEELGFRVTSFDIYRTENTDLLCDGHNLPFVDGMFDVVYSSQVFEHLRWPWQAMGEIERVLRPGGVFVGSVAFIKPAHYSYFHMTFRGMWSLFEDVGMKIDHVHAAQSILWSLIIKMLPFRLPVRLRPAIRSFCMKIENGYWNLYSRVWKLRSGEDSNKEGNRIIGDLQLNYEQFHRLMFTPAVVFRGRKLSE